MFTSTSSGPFGLRNLHHIVSADIAGTFTAQLDAYKNFTATERTSVNHGNAWTLFPRLGPPDNKAA
jgi:hypothetical protein